MKTVHINNSDLYFGWAAPEKCLFCDYWNLGTRYSIGVRWNKHIWAVTWPWPTKYQRARGFGFFTRLGWAG